MLREAARIRRSVAAFRDNAFVRLLARVLALMLLQVAFAVFTFVITTGMVTFEAFRLRVSTCPAWMHVALVATKGAYV